MFRARFSQPSIFNGSERMPEIRMTVLCILIGHLVKTFINDSDYQS